MSIPGVDKLFDRIFETEKKLEAAEKDKEVLLQALKSLLDTAIYKRDDEWVMTDFTHDQFIKYITNIIQLMEEKK